MVTRNLVILVAFALLAASGCAGKGPCLRAREYDQALKQEQAGALAAFSVDENGAELDADAFYKALRLGAVGEEVSEASWKGAEADAKIRAGGNLYLLRRMNGEWKVHCTNAGPFHDRTPEMTLLLAIHAIKKGDFELLSGLLPSDLEQAKKPFPKPFKDDLLIWARELQSRVCEPFNITGDEAVLDYGSGLKKTLRLVREGKSWRILDLW